MEGNTVRIRDLPVKLGQGEGEMGGQGETARSLGVSGSAHDLSLQPFPKSPCPQVSLSRHNARIS